METSSKSKKGEYLSTDLFQKALKNVQTGSWEEGFVNLEALQAEFPYDRDLADFIDEMRIRRKISVYEEEENEESRKKQMVNIAWRAGAGLVILVIVFFGLRTYASWFRNQFDIIRQSAEVQVAELELSMKLRDAEQLLLAGQYDSAKNLLIEIAEEDPDYPGLEDLQRNLDDASTLEMKYQEAQSFMASSDHISALAVLQEIFDEDPNYSDVAVLIQELESLTLLSDLIVEANTAYDDHDWDEAASNYEIVRAVSPKYEAELVEERLLDSYLNAALEVLDVYADVFEAMEVAERYFNKALALRPQNAEVKRKQEVARSMISTRLFDVYVASAKEAITSGEDSLEALAIAEKNFGLALSMRPDDAETLRERKLARAFLQSQNDFRIGLWNQVITNLEYVHNEEPNYANGTARQTLFDAYVARGDVMFSAGEYEAALSNFQSAAVLANEISEGEMQQIEAKLKLAETQGVLGNYETAVNLYRDAVSLGNFAGFAEDNDPELAKVLEDAEYYADIRYFRTSFNFYRTALSSGNALFSLVSYIVQDGDYLPLLAARYNSTLKAILVANDLSSSKSIQSGETLIIPVLTEKNIED